MTTQDLEVCGDSFVLENNPEIPQKRVGWYCGTYTGKVTEIPIFTLRLRLSETSGVAPGGQTSGSRPHRYPQELQFHRNDFVPTFPNDVMFKVSTCEISSVSVGNVSLQKRNKFTAAVRKTHPTA